MGILKPLTWRQKLGQWREICQKAGITGCQKIWRECSGRLKKLIDYTMTECDCWTLQCIITFWCEAFLNFTDISSHCVHRSLPQFLSLNPQFLVCRTCCISSHIHDLLDLFLVFFSFFCIHFVTIFLWSLITMSIKLEFCLPLFSATRDSIHLPFIIIGWASISAIGILP